MAPGSLVVPLQVIHGIEAIAGLTGVNAPHGSDELTRDAAKTPIDNEYL